jgi:hypothetical protein
MVKKLELLIIFNMKTPIYILLVLIIFSCCPTKKITSNTEVKSVVNDSISVKQNTKQDLIINTEIVSHREVISEQLIEAYCNEKGKVVIANSKISSGNNKASVKSVENGFLLTLQLGAYEEKNKELTSQITEYKEIVSQKNKEISSLKEELVVKSKTPSWVWYLILALGASLYLNFNNAPIKYIRKILRL